MLSPPTGRLPLCRAEVLRAIDDYLRLSINAPVFVSELCEAARVSQPTLFRIFHEVFGMGPKQYLQIRRLHQVRRQLLRGIKDSSVSSVAFDYGFWQLGRFGQAYKTLFGETPSQTLRSRSKDALVCATLISPDGSLGLAWNRS
jgi:AraC-like DNA-binding protein